MREGEGREGVCVHVCVVMVVSFLFVFAIILLKSIHVQLLHFCEGQIYYDMKHGKDFYL